MLSCLMLWEHTAGMSWANPMGCSCQIVCFRFLAQHGRHQEEYSDKEQFSTPDMVCKHFDSHSGRPFLPQQGSRWDRDAGACAIQIQMHHACSVGGSAGYLQNADDHCSRRFFGSLTQTVMGPITLDQTTQLLCITTSHRPADPCRRQSGEVNWRYLYILYDTCFPKIL